MQIVFGLLGNEDSSGGSTTAGTSSATFDLKLPLLSIQILNALFEQTGDSVFKALSVIMQKYVFCFDTALLQKLPGILKINLATKKYSFWELTTELCRFIESLKEAREEKELSMAARICVLEEQVQAKDSEIVNGRKSMETVQKACEDQFAADRAMMLESIQTKNKEISQLSDELQVLMKQVKTQEGIFLQNQTELRLQIRQAEIEFAQKSSVLQATIDKLNTDNFAQANQMFIMKDSYATQLISIRTFKDRIRELESKMGLIIEENQRLNARAGTNFFELTPRPSFESIDSIIAPVLSAQLAQQPTANGNAGVNVPTLNQQNIGTNTPTTDSQQLHSTGLKSGGFVNFQTISTQKRVEEKARLIAKFVQDLKSTYEDRINVLITQSQSIHITENKKKAKVIIKQPNRREVPDRPNRTFYPPTSLLTRKSIAPQDGLQLSGGEVSFKPMIQESSQLDLISSRHGHNNSKKSNNSQHQQQEKHTNNTSVHNALSPSKDFSN